MPNFIFVQDLSTDFRSRVFTIVAIKCTKSPTESTTYKTYFKSTNRSVFEELLQRLAHFAPYAIVSKVMIGILKQSYIFFPTRKLFQMLCLSAFCNVDIT